MPSQHFDVDYETLEQSPEDWSGPHHHTYLGGYIATRDKSRCRFDDFNKAVELANTIDDCKGITMIYLNKKYIYELRRGNSHIPTPANPKKISTALASWVKN